MDDDESKPSDIAGLLFRLFEQVSQAAEAEQRHHLFHKKKKKTLEKEEENLRFPERLVEEA